MNTSKLLKGAAYALGATGLLTGTFVVVAAISGTSLSSLPVVGGMFPAPPAPEEQVADQAPPTIEEEVSQDRRPSRQVIDGATNVLESFVLEQPWSSTELERLEQTLEARMAALDERTYALAKREQDLEERIRHYDELYAQLQNMYEQLVAERDEADARRDELDQAEAAKEEGLRESRRMAAELYSDGKATDAAARLLRANTPSEAGKILAFLDVDRARELMEAIHKNSPEEYPEVETAWRGAAPAGR